MPVFLLKTSGQKFVEAITPLWLWVEDLVRKMFPALADFISKHLLDNLRPNAIFPTVALNLPAGEGKASIHPTHLDKNDFPEAVTVLIPFGDYEGSLTLPDLSTEVVANPGDVIVFKASRMRHATDVKKGKRKSLVFFIHTTSLHPPLPKKKKVRGK